MSTDLDYFGAFRGKPGPTLYADQYVAVTEDVTWTAIFTLFLIVLISFIFTVLGQPGNERLYSFLRYLLATGIAAVILVCTYGHSWYVGYVSTSTEYKAFTTEHISADVGLYVGLKEANVTLKGTPEVQLGEKIHYSERLYMDRGSSLKLSYKGLLKAGVPYPILWVAEYMSTDAGNTRWGRNFRLAGHYAFILLWTAFSSWVTACILFCISLRRGAWMSVFTGATMILANIVYVFLSHYEKPLAIPFEDGMMNLALGWSYWLTLVAGFFTIILGTAILIVDNVSPEFTTQFFGIEAPTVYDIDDDDVIQQKASQSTLGKKLENTDTVITVITETKNNLDDAQLRQKLEKIETETENMESAKKQDPDVQDTVPDADIVDDEMRSSSRQNLIPRNDDKDFEDNDFVDPKS